MSTASPHLTIHISLDKERLRTQLIYHNLFRQLRPSRKKYGLSGTDLLVLNGIYLYSLLVKADFTFTAVLRFVKYYNDQRMRYYFNKLLDRGLIEHHRTANTHIYYRVSDAGLDIINELFNDYDAIHAKFISEFNISL